MTDTSVQPQIAALSRCDLGETVFFQEAALTTQICPVSVWMTPFLCRIPHLQYFISVQHFFSLSGSYSCCGVLHFILFHSGTLCAL